MINPNVNPGQAIPQGSATYAQRFASPSNDPFRNDYLPVLVAFDSTNQAMTPGALLEQVLGSTEIPQAFAIICSVDQHVKIYILHQPARYMAQIGRPPTQWDNPIFATNGEVTGNFVVTIQFPKEPFKLSPVVQVLPNDQIDEYFATHPQAEVINVIEHNATSSIKIRACCLI